VDDFSRLTLYTEFMLLLTLLTTLSLAADAPQTDIAPHLQEAIKSTQALLNQIEGLPYRLTDDTIHLQGEVFDEDDLDLVRAFATHTPEVESTVRMGLMCAYPMAGLLETEVNMPGVTVRQVNSSFLIDGVVYTESQSKRVEAIVRGYVYGDYHVINALEIRTAHPAYPR